MTPFQFDEETTRQIRIEAGRISGKVSDFVKNRELDSLAKRLFKRAEDTGKERWEVVREVDAFIDAVVSRMAELDRQKAEEADKGNIVSILRRAS